METKEEFKKRVIVFRNILKDYRVTWFKIIKEEYSSQDKETLFNKEERLREELMEDWGRFKTIFLRLNVPTITVTPSIGYNEHIFEEALSGRLFDNPLKGASLINAISSATQAIGIVDSLNEEEFKVILKGPQKITSPLAPFTAEDFLFIKDEKLKEIIRRDYSEIVKNFATECYKSVIILCGGIIEALLLYKLRENEQVAKKSNKAPKEDDIEKWDLNHLIEVATDIKIIKEPAINKLSHSVRDYRNLIHPGKELKSGLKVKPEEAKIAFEVLNILIREFKMK